MSFIVPIVVESLQLSKPQAKFLCTFFSTLFILPSRATIANLARFSSLSERTFRRNYQKSWGFPRLNSLLIDLLGLGECIAVMDSTTTPKSGSKTFGVGWFWSGSRNRMIRGLEVSCIAIVSMEFRTAFALSVRQTLAKTRKLSRIDHYLKQVQGCKRQLRRRVKYFVADGFYSKKEFVDGVCGIGIDFIGRLRQDANMRYLYKGKHPKRKGPKRKYSGKFKGIHRRRFRLISNFSNKRVKLYCCELYHVSLKRKVRVAALLDNKNRKYILLFSTDLNIEPEKIIDYYSARFQIEFLFRDAKQQMGFGHCQSRSKKALDFHFNATLTAVNIAKVEILSKRRIREKKPISIADFKIAQSNQFWIKIIISKLELDPNLIINHPNFKAVLNFGRRVA